MGAFLTKNKLISKDTTLPINQHFNINNLSIKDCTLSLEDQGILSLTCKTDIIIENGQINLTGKTNANGTYGNVPKPNYTYCGHKINQIYIGKEGHDGDSCSGGYGGGGLRLICERLILTNSIINVSGSHCCNGNEWWCGPGDGGSCLIICKEFIMDNYSKVLARNGANGTVSGAGRIVIQIKHLLTSNQTSYLISGYLRCNYNPIFIDDICNLCLLFFSTNNYTNYKISPKPIFVDDKWNAITDIDTLNTWRKCYGRIISQNVVEIQVNHYGDRSNRYRYIFEKIAYSPQFKCEFNSKDSSIRVRLDTPELGGRVRAQIAKSIADVDAENIELIADQRRIPWDDELFHENILHLQIQFCVVGYDTKTFDCMKYVLYKVHINPPKNSMNNVLVLFRYYQNFIVKDFVNDLFLWMDKEKWFDEHKDLVRLYFGKNERKKGDNISYYINMNGCDIGANHGYKNNGINGNGIVKLKVELLIIGK